VATVSGLTKDRMLAIEAASVVSGEVDVSGDLILERHDGTQFNAGHVHGADGADATALMTVTDTDSTDITLDGAGTPADPWNLSVEVKDIAYDLLPNLTVTGLLSASYRGPGPATVRIDGEGSDTTNVPWLVPYEPSASRRVTLARYGAGWAIVGQTSYETITGGHRTLPLQLATNWVTYNESVGDTDWAEPRITQLPSGLVALSGLIRFSGGVPAAGSDVVINIPVGMRPDHPIIHWVNNSDTARVIDITTDGKIKVRGLWASNGYISLDGIAYWPSGTATWTTVPTGSFGSSFESQSGDVTNFGPVRYFKDPYGFVWLSGLVRVKVAVSTDNTPIFSLPADHRASAEQHMRVAGQDAYSGLGAQPGNGVNWKPGSPAGVGQWITLNGAVITTADAVANNPWYNLVGIINSWAVHAGAWPTPAVVRRGDGLCMSKGLLSGGAYGTTRAFVTPREIWPDRGRLIVDSIGNNNRIRWDISGEYENDYGGNRKRGGFSPVNGSAAAAWVSLDSMKWVTTSS